VSVVISIATAIIIGHFLIKGLQALLLYLLPPHRLSSEDNDNNKYEKDHSNLETIINTDTSYPFDIRHYDPCDFLHNLIKSPRPHRDNYSDNKAYESESEGYLPRLTPRPVPLPVKHMVNIVNRLRRRVNQSGKEPLAVILTLWLPLAPFYKDFGSRAQIPLS
jgi:hypothetical protein